METIITCESPNGIYSTPLLGVGGGTMKFSFSRDVFTGLYSTTLLGGEFSNCHGQGSTIEGAVSSLKMRVYQLRRKTL
jgi:hypothetical protein